MEWEARNEAGQHRRGFGAVVAAFGVWGLAGVPGVIAVFGAGWGAFRWHLRRTQRTIHERWESLSDAQRLAAMATLSERDRAEVIAAINEDATRRAS